MSTSARRPDRGTDEERAERLKERIYVTFAALAVVLSLRSHSEDVTAGEIAETLIIAVLGTLLAVFLADFVSHLAVHAELPSRAQLAHMARVSFGSLSTIVLPMLFVAAAALGWWSVAAALTASTVALLLALAVVGYLAVRRVAMPPWQRVVVLLAELVLGVVVVGLELLAHG